MSQATLLIEIGCEDLPARFVQPLAQALGEGIAQGLDSAHVPRGSARSFATPRRIAVQIAEVATEQPEQRIQRQGPAVKAALREDQPTPAGLGFAKSCGVEFEALERRATDKGEYLFFASTQAGQTLSELLPGIFEQCLKQMDRLVPKRMRWGSGDATFVRPVQWLCALHGAAVVPLSAFGLQASGQSYGHRFHAPAPLPLTDADSYEPALREAWVWADFAARRDAIAAMVQAEGAKLGGQARVDDDLLDEVTALVEWPAPISGQFDQRFLEVPAEAIVLTIEEHQRYFPVFDEQGHLLPAFITVANLESIDPAQVVAGNERVVRPRLDDALFFWQQDRKQPLDSRLDELDRVTWAKGLGSLRDKATRLEQVCRALAPAFEVDAEQAARAGRLAKCDLISQCVFEMPELQGVMGGHFLRAEDANNAELADAVAAHYRPAGPGEAIPQSRLGQLLALADKLDTLCGYFSIDAIPTASKDPFGLRRAALGALRILLEGERDLDAAPLLDSSSFELSSDQREKLVDFLHDRLRGLLTEQGMSSQVVSAVLAAASGPLDAQRRAQAVATFMHSAAGEALAASSKRVRNILRDAELAGTAIDTTLLQHAAEAGLYQALTDSDIAAPLADADYAAALSRLAQLQAPIDAFFAEVMVNVDDAALQTNRLALLAAFDAACSQIADFSVLASGA